MTKRTNITNLTQIIKKQPGHRQFLSRAVESWEGVSFIVTGDHDHDDHDDHDDNGHDHDGRVVCMKHIYIRYNKANAV